MRRQAGQGHCVKFHLCGKAIASRGAVVFALAVGFGDVAGVVSSSGASTATITASTAVSSETPAPPPNPSGPTGGGGALPVVPAAGACIIGLNCGCIRNITCPGAVHHRPAPSNDHPQVPAAGPLPGPGGGG